MIVDPAMQPILWENANLSCFGGGCKGKRCHLMSQTYITVARVILKIFAFSNIIMRNLIFFGNQNYSLGIESPVDTKIDGKEN
jgi:hypothetical protein